MLEKPKSLLVHVDKDGKPTIADPRVFVRMKALEAAAAVMAGAIEVEGVAFSQVATKTLEAADMFNRWLEVGEERTGATGSVEPPTRNAE